MRRKKSNTLLIVLLVLVIIAASILGGMIWFLNTHFFVDGRAYANNADFLDLREQELTVGDFENIQIRLPACEILWSVPFQGGTVSSDTKTLTVDTLRDEDLAMLAYLPELKAVDASGCRDYGMLMKLQAEYPGVDLSYTVTIGGQEYPQDAAAVVCPDLSEEEIALMAYLPELRAVDASGCREYDRLAVLAEAFPHVDISYQVELLGQTFNEATVAAEFEDPDVDVLLRELAYVSHLEQVHLEQPSASAESLLALTEAYPEISFTWNKTVLGKTFSSEDTEFDFSGMQFDTTDTVEEAMKYFPKAEKVIMSKCGIDNETMAAFREKMRPEYKVVWTVYVTKVPVRTDETVFHSSAHKVCLIDEQSYDLKYCEDMIVVDIGHSYVKYIEWVRYMPNLKYLILAHNWIKDLTPIADCKNLVYLELFWNKHIPDFTPLQGCTALEDLNISETYADLEPLKEMTWLKNLWANMRGVTQAEHNELQEALPNTTVMTRGGTHNALGWRQLQNYFDMRDIMGLPYNKW